MAIHKDEMRKRLEAKRAELTQNIAGLTETRPPTNRDDEASDIYQDIEDNAVDATERQKEQSIGENEQALLADVEAALERIKDGTYGYCIDCGRPIPEKRLEALPWASRLVEHEASLERRALSREELLNRAHDYDTHYS